MTEEPRAVLVIIGEDPRISHRANEAMRIALGLVASETPVHIVLIGDAVHLLDEDTDDLVDGDDIAKFRGTLRDLGVPFHVEEIAIPRDASWNPDRHPVIPATARDVAELASSARRFLVF